MMYKKKVLLHLNVFAEFTILYFQLASKTAEKLTVSTVFNCMYSTYKSYPDETA